MDLKEEIKQKVQEYLKSGRYQTTELQYIPDKSDAHITFGNKGVTVTGTALHIDMRNSTLIMKKHHKDTIAKIHKAYLHIAASLVRENDGFIRSFNGDGMLAFFYGDKGSIDRAVRAAMQIKYMITQECSGLFKKYDALDFGIGIHYGEMLVVKTGLTGANNNDLLWIGEPVNFAVKMGDAAKQPFNIRISSVVYKHLEHQLKFIDDSLDLFILQVPFKTDVWKANHDFYFGGEKRTVFDTKYGMELY